MFISIVLLLWLNAAVVPQNSEPLLIAQARSAQHSSLTDGGRSAVMRYRKKYRVDNGRLSRRGEVIQELRWQQVGREWLILSERDIRVLK